MTRLALEHVMEVGRVLPLLYLSGTALSVALALTSLPWHTTAIWLLAYLAYVAARTYLTSSFVGLPEARRRALHRRYTTLSNTSGFVHGGLWAVFYVVAALEGSEEVRVCLLVHLMVITVLALILVPGTTVGARGFLMLPLAATAAVWWWIPPPGYGLLLPIAVTAAIPMIEIALRLQGWALKKRLTLSEENARLAAKLKRRNEMLRQRNEESVKLLATASHDLRQPIHALGMLLHSWRADMGAAEHANRLTLTRHSIDHVSDMLNSLLDAARIDTGLYKPQLTVFRVDELLQTMAGTFEHMATQKGLYLLVKCQPATAKCDAVLLRRVISNLLTNAIKFTTEGGVCITGQLDCEGYTVQVHDTGIGIAPEHHREVFEDFRSFNHSLNPGLGLGLAIARRSCQVMGARISLQSSLGKGTRICVALPTTCLVASAPHSSETRPSPLGTTAPQHRILLIEDDQVALTATASALTGWGYQVVCLQSASGFESVADTSFDLALSDLHLESAYAGLNLLRALKRSCGARTILMTGDIDPSITAMAEEVGVSEVLHKPVRPSHLRRAVASALGERDDDAGAVALQAH